MIKQFRVKTQSETMVVVIEPCQWPTIDTITEWFDAFFSIVSACDKTNHDVGADRHTVQFTFPFAGQRAAFYLQFEANSQSLWIEPMSQADEPGIMAFISYCRAQLAPARCQ